MIPAEYEAPARDLISTWPELPDEVYAEAAHLLAPAMRPKTLAMKKTSRRAPACQAA